MITRTGTHVIKALAYLGDLPDGGYAGAAAIAARIRAPGNYLGKLLRQLSRAGLVKGQRGAKGGFRLARESGEIALYDVLAPVEQLDRISDCFLGRPRCTEDSPCALHSRWAVIRAEYLDFLRRTSLRQIIEAAHAAPGKRGKASPPRTIGRKEGVS